jgi:CBS-domain-containing membrane protein
MRRRFVNWIIYWLVPLNCTTTQINHRLFEVGACIGIIIGCIMTAFVLK